MNLILKLQYKLNTSPPFLTFWAALSSFGAYFCMYMYRKPYTSAIFENSTLWDIDFKIVLVSAQIAGYALSKFLGIKIISSMHSHHRVIYYISLIGLAFLSLVGFAFTPNEFGPLFLFINGLALGMIWGVVFQFLEGRSITEILTVILSANFILTSGIAKSIGQYILSHGFEEKSMPMFIGLIFLPLSILFILMLSYVPPQSQEDNQLRVSRTPMNDEHRSDVKKKYFFLIILFIINYIILTIIRDVRDNFGVNIWHDLGFGKDVSIYTSTEIPATILILVLIGMLYKIKNNIKALQINLILMIIGLIILILSTIGFISNIINPVMWMVMTGVGLFIPYILFNGIFFDRFIGAFTITANVGFFMYIVDAFGYLGSVGIMIYKNFGNNNISWLQFYTNLVIFAGIIGILTMVLTWFKIHDLIKNKKVS